MNRQQNYDRALAAARKLAARLRVPSVDKRPLLELIEAIDRAIKPPPIDAVGHILVEQGGSINVQET